MKTTFWLMPLALGLAACTTYDPYGSQGYPPEPYPSQQPYPPQGPYPPQPPYPAPPAPYPGQDQGNYRAIGTEPFWDLEIGDQMVFTDRGNNVVVSQPTPRPINGTAGEIYRTQRIEVNVTHVRCSDGMSDRTYPDTVQVYIDGQMYRGCGAPSAFYSSIGEDGLPKAPPPPPPLAGPGDAIPLDKTRWRVVAINNRPTPRDGNFSMQFSDGRLSATLGCNGLGAGYTQSGATLDAGIVMGTKMACPDMSWEQQGSAILGDLMTLRMLDRNRIVLNAQSGSIELIRQ
jgi:heat shock protein HslJ